MESSIGKKILQISVESNEVNSIVFVYSNEANTSIDLLHAFIRNIPVNIQ